LVFGENILLLVYILDWPDSQFVYVCYFFVIFCGLRFSHILLTVICMQLLHVLHVHSVRPAPTMSRIHLIIIEAWRMLLIY